MISHLQSVIFLFASFVVSARSAEKSLIDTIGFPEYEENPLLVNKQDRIPVYMPSRCPENELFYPGDQTDDWICDCRPGYLFEPISDKCWPALRRGPCVAEQYLVLLNTSRIPKCVPNPCKEDSMVLWKGECLKLGSSACGVTFPAKVLWVNAATIQPDCVNVTVNERFNNNDLEVTTVCPPGCRRSVQSKCKPEKV